MAETFDSGVETTLRDFLNVIFRRKWLILAIVGVATTMVVYLNARQPQIYESMAKILVRRGEQGSLLSPGSIRYLSWVEEVSSQIEVILSEAVLDRAGEIFADSIAANGLPETWKFNRGSVRADVIGESNAFVIKYVDLNPAVVRYGCEAVTIGFQGYYAEKKAPPALSDFFAEEVTDVQVELAYWREKKTEFYNRSKFFGLEETSRFMLNRMAALEASMGSVNADISSQMIRLQMADELRHKKGDELENELSFSDRGQVALSQVLQTIKYALQNARMRREELVQKYTERHPEVVAVNAQIAELQSDLKQQIENLYVGEAAELDQLKARKESLQKEINSVRRELDRMPDQALELARIDEMINKLEEKHQLLYQQQANSEIAIASAPDWEVTVLSHAGPPSGRRTRDYVRLALGPFLSLIVALGIAFFFETMDHSVNTMAEAEEFFDTPVLATISEFSKTDTTGTG